MNPKTIDGAFGLRAATEPDRTVEAGTLWR